MHFIIYSKKLNFSTFKETLECVYRENYTSMDVDREEQEATAFHERFASHASGEDGDCNKQPTASSTGSILLGAEETSSLEGSPMLRRAPDASGTRIDTSKAKVTDDFLQYKGSIAPSPAASQSHVRKRPSFGATHGSLTPRKRGPHIIDSKSAALLKAHSNLSTAVRPTAQQNHHRSSTAPVAVDSMISAMPKSLDANLRGPKLTRGNSNMSRSGWLSKEFRKFRVASGWHHRYFICAHGALQYFKKRPPSAGATPRGEILLGDGCNINFSGDMNNEGLYPFSVIFQDKTLPALHVAAESLEDARAWVQTLRNNVNNHFEKPHKRDETPGTDSKSHNGDQSTSLQVEKHIDAKSSGRADSKIVRRLTRTRSRQASFIVVVDSGDEIEEDESGTSAAKSFEDSSRIKNTLKTSHHDEATTIPSVSIPSTQSMEQPSLFLQEEVPWYFQAIAAYIFDIRIPRPSNWKLIRLAQRLRIFRDTYAESALHRNTNYQQPLLTRCCIKGCPSVVGQLLLDLTAERSKWDPSFSYGSAFDKPGNAKLETYPCKEDTAVYVTRSYSIAPPLSFPCLLPRSFTVGRLFKEFSDGSILIVFDSDAPTAKSIGYPLKTDEVQGKMRGGMWISPASATGNSMGSNSDASIVTMCLQIDAKGWVGRDSIVGRTFQAEECLTEYMLSAVAGLRDFVEEHLHFTGMVPGLSCPDTVSTSQSQQVANSGFVDAPRSEDFETKDSGSVPNLSSTAYQDTSTGAPRLSLTEIEKMDEEIRSWSLIRYARPSECAKTNDDSVIKCWSQTEAKIFQVRGVNYLEDRIKMTSPPSCLRLIACDLTMRGRRPDAVANDYLEPLNRVAWMEHGLVQRVQRKYGSQAPFLLVINFMIPGGMNNVMYFRVPAEDGPEEDGASNSVKMLRKFMSPDVDDEYRDARLKIIPNVVEGGWVVQRGVGNKPAIIGKKITQTYHAGENWFEIDIDIGSSRVAGAILGLVKGYTKVLVIDLAFLLESKTTEELPERLLGSARYFRMNLEELPEFPE